MSKVWVYMVAPIVISTFAGCGGSSLGYKLAGYRELLAVEIDNNAVETFKRNFPEVPMYHGDITSLSGEECMKLAGIKKGELDVLDGSPPCQGFSTAGKRKFDDPRNSLFKEFARLLKELQPKVFVMENVTGMVKGYMKQAYLQIVKTLRECGYKVKGQVMNAMYYNVPQSRERVIIIGVREDLGIEPSHPKPQSKPKTAKQAIKHLEELGGNNDPRFKTLKAGKSIYSYNSGSIRIWPDRPSPTIKGPGAGGSKGGNVNIHYSKNRYLTIDEIKTLSSFPGNFKLLGNTRDKVDRIGNSVPPNFMRAIAEHIKNEILRKIRVSND